MPNIKGGAFVINLDDYKSIGTYWIALYVNNDHVTNFDSFWVEHISKEIYNLSIEYKSMIQLCVDTFALDLWILW